MTEKDISLIQEARNTPYIDWSIIDYLIEEAETKEAKEKLESIQVTKYHLEEYS